jgi:DNA-binding CsgD family transcriptional regulator
MFDLSSRTASAHLPQTLHHPASSPSPCAHPAPYGGPERRTAASSGPHWMAATLDELDYGVLLLHGDAQVLHVNHAARSELDEDHPLQLLDGRLRVRRSLDGAALTDALDNAAARGLRKLLTLGKDAHRVSVSVVPLASHAETGSAGDPVVLVILGKRQVCEVLSVQGFARSHGLSAAEARVLTLLCHGTPPTAIAAQVGVRISTVRSQIGNIRIKTGAASIRALVRQVAVLPPLMGVLRGVPSQRGAWNDSGLVGA